MIDSINTLKYRNFSKVNYKRIIKIKLTMNNQINFTESYAWADAQIRENYFQTQMYIQELQAEAESDLYNQSAVEWYISDDEEEQDTSLLVRKIALSQIHMEIIESDAEECETDTFPMDISDDELLPRQLFSDDDVTEDVTEDDNYDDNYDDNNEDFAILREDMLDMYRARLRREAEIALVAAAATTEVVDDDYEPEFIIENIMMYESNDVIQDISIPEFRRQNTIIGWDTNGLPITNGNSNGSKFYEDFLDREELIADLSSYHHRLQVEDNV